MIRLPAVGRGPLRALGVRLAAAIGLILFMVSIVYFDRDGYRDANGDGLTLLDCFYYTVVSLSTTGYGDITPVTPEARLVNVLVVTPARVLFLIILVGTTLQVLTDQYRTTVRVTRWRKTLRDHVVVCGYGTKGRSAVRALIENGTDQKKIVVVESDPNAARQATADGLVVIEDSATRSSVLMDARVTDASSVIIATNTDEAAVLVTLTVRQLTSGTVRIIAAVREDENAALLRQSGAHHVVVSSATAGRLLGMTSSAPPLVDVVEDLLTPGRGIALAMRSAKRDEVGLSTRDLDEVILAIYRHGKARSVTGRQPLAIETGDMLIYVRDDRPDDD